jgi:eukaryotic-like serine/threonine-protein kinase
MIQETQEAKEFSTNSVQFHQFNIEIDNPIEHLRTPFAQAFEVTSNNNYDHQLYALVFDPKHYQRFDILDIVTQTDFSACVNLYNWDIIEWPNPQSERMVAIFSKPPGMKLMESINDQVAPFTEEHLNKSIIRPIANIIRKCMARGITLRAIRPTNLYSGGHNNYLLGEFISGPPGFQQPAVCETIKSAMAHPSARGPGTIADDLYSLGVTIAILLIGENPLSKLSDDEIIEQKIQLSSYGALLSNHRVSLAMMEPLRGLLMDDPEERWSIKELDFWIDGRRVSPKQSVIIPKAKRNFSFLDKKYNNIRMLCSAFHYNPIKALSDIKSEEFNVWLVRGLGDKKLADKIAQQIAINDLQTDTSTPEKTLTQMCLQLDPTSPIRYKNFNVHIDGIGNALAENFNDSTTRQIIREIINAKLPLSWLSAQKKVRVALSKFLAIYDNIYKYSINNKYGYGLECIVYELNPYHPCQSPLLDNYYTNTPKKILLNLNKLAATSIPQSCPVDRHIAAYIKCRGGSKSSFWLKALNDFNNNQDNAIAIFEFYGYLQNHYHTGPLPHLTKWIYEYSSKNLFQYKSLKRLEFARKQLEKSIGKGCIQDILNITCNKQLTENDSYEYREAKILFLQLNRFIKEINNEQKNINQTSKQLGARFASIVCATISFSSILYVMYRFSF